MGYDDQYASTAALFGEEPDEWLVRHEHLINVQSRALDVGAGQGRHALHLARRGVRVDALDSSEVGLEQLAAAMGGERLPLRTIAGRWEDWNPHPGSYDTVLLFGLIQLVAREKLPELVARVESWTKPCGLVFVTAHTTDDVGHALRAAGLAGWTRVGVGSYRSDRGEIRTYLEPGELVRVFGSLECVDVEESLGPEHRHGDGAPERHARAMGLFRRR